MFGRLKLALVALVLMPATAFAAAPSPRHLPGPSVEPQAVEAEVATAPAASHKHRAIEATGAVGPSTIELFLAGLGGPSSSGFKQAATVAPASGPSTMAIFLASLGDGETVSAPPSRAKHAAPLPAADTPARSGGHRSS